jgi:hypothetical protein
LKPFIYFIILLLSFSAVQAQVKFSLATDFSVLRNFDGQQPFTVAGQTLNTIFHFDEKNSVYAWFTYHANGKYHHTLSAYGKTPAIQPQQFSFTNRSEMRLRHLSIGVRRYFTGSYKKLENFNFYGGGGFGLIMGNASNNFSVPVDTTIYLIQDNIIPGSGDFKRLTLDLTAGIEFPVAYEIFVFSEARLHIPTTEYPNTFLLKNNNAPFLGGLNLGIRILFNYER